MTVRVGRPAERVAELVLDRPEALNAVSTEQAQAITAACTGLAGEPGLSVVVLTSSSAKAFSVGADLKERAGFTDEDLRGHRPLSAAAYRSVLELPMVTVAAVEGYALGGGCELALACDLVVAGDSAVFALPEVSRGLVPGGGGTQLLSRRVGLNRAADLILTGRHVAADEAARLGLVDRLVPAGEARAAALALAEQIAANSPVALRAAKAALRSGFDEDLAAGLEREDRAWHSAAFSADRREGITAFTERRAPRWPDPPGESAALR